MDESAWVERAQNAEAALKTCRDQIERVKETHRAVMETLGARQRSDGSIDIDFDELAKRLPLEQALELRAAIDQHHRVSGGAGAKPKVRITA